MRTIVSQVIPVFTYEQLWRLATLDSFSPKAKLSFRLSQLDPDSLRTERELPLMKPTLDRFLNLISWNLIFAFSSVLKLGPKLVKFLCQLLICCFPDRLLRDNARVDVCFKIIYCFLELESILYHFLLCAFRLNAHLVNFFDHFLDVFNEIVMACTRFFTWLVDDLHEYLSVVSYSLA